MPYLVSFLDGDPGDPMQFSPRVRWLLCSIVGYLTFSVAFISSAYASGVSQMVDDLGGSEELATLGLSLFLIGFVLGPFLWAPISGTTTLSFPESQVPFPRFLVVTKF